MTLYNKSPKIEYYVRRLNKKNGTWRPRASLIITFFIIWRHFNPHALVDTRQKSSTNAKQGKSSVKMPNQALFTNQFIWKV